MKTERRHELQHNELSDWLGRNLEENQGTLKVVAGVVIALFAIGLGYVYLSQQQESRQGIRWNDFFNVLVFSDNRLTDEEELASRLRGVADKHSGTLPGLWALQSQANLDLASGAGKLFRDRKAALDDLEQAKKTFERVVKDARQFPLLHQQALFGLAQAQECLGDISDARKSYGEVRRAAGESALGKLAERRAKDLANSTTEDFYKWFAQQTPQPAMMRPNTSSTGLPPLDFGSLPKSPILDSTDSDSATTPATDKPAVDADKPATTPENPAAEKPATEKPSDDATKKPAEPAKPEENATKPAAESSPAADATKPDATKADSTKPATDPAKPATEPAKPADSK